MEMEGLTLIINAGSSSVKFSLYQGRARILNGVVDRIGNNAVLQVKSADGVIDRPVKVSDYKTAGEQIISVLGDTKPDLVVHRVVHGGKHESPVLLNRAAIEKLRELIPLAPLHLPPAIALIEFFHRHARVKAIACFDTLFHRTIPDVAKTYAIPQSLARKYGIERYGFHGLAHADMLHQLAARLGKKRKELSVITCQLGNGASICAIKNGVSVDTTMGFTPLEGVVMGTRSGNIDPAIIPFLCDMESKTADDILEILEKESGLFALGGYSDVRDLLEKERHGVHRAALALDIFIYWIRKRIGAYFAVLGEVDAVVLGGGISDSPAMRWALLEGMESFGVKMDVSEFWKNGPHMIGGGKVQAWVVHVDEDAEMLRLVEDYLKK